MSSQSLDRASLRVRDRVVERVAELYGVEARSILSRRRNPRMVTPRFVAMYLCREAYQYSYPEIAWLFNRGDHTTAMNAVRTVLEVARHNRDFAELLASELIEISRTAQGRDGLKPISSLGHDDA